MAQTNYFIEAVESADASREEGISARTSRRAVSFLLWLQCLKFQLFILAYDFYKGCKLRLYKCTHGYDVSLV